MSNAALSKEINALLTAQVQGVLATLDGEQPCLHLMAYAFSDDLADIYLASYADTRKVSNMLNQPRVSLLWDNRTGNNRDHVEGMALNATGEARLLDGTVRQGAIAKLLVRNPSLEKLLGDEKTAVFAVSVARYVFAQGYTKVREYCPG